MHQMNTEDCRRARSATFLFVLLSAAGTAVAQTPRSNTTPPGAVTTPGAVAAGEQYLRAKEVVPATQPARGLIEVALNARVGELRAEGQSLAQVVDTLRTDTGQNIFVNWRALESIRVKKDLPVTTDLSHLTLAEAVEKLLAEIGGSQERLGYQIDDGVLCISTLKDLGKNTLTRVYDVRDLLKDPKTRDADLAAITKRFRGFDPLSWKDAGGDVGAIRVLQGQLIVTQTPEVHQRIILELEKMLPGRTQPKVPMSHTRLAPDHR
jgi:hypothetical protein